VGLPLHERILDSIEAYFGLSPQMLALSVEATHAHADQPVGRLSLKTAREWVSDPTSPPSVGDAIWSQLIRLAGEQKEPWELAAVWMMVPGLRRICRRCRRYGAPLDLGELEAEAVAGFVEALRMADPDQSTLGGWLWWTTYRHVQQVSSRARYETPTADIELVGNQRIGENDSSRMTQPGPNLIDGAMPVVDEPGVVGSASLEGERLGALAYRLGLEQAFNMPEGPAEEAA
jgi:hypothetical protein